MHTHPVYFKENCIVHACQGEYQRVPIFLISRKLYKVTMEHIVCGPGEAWPHPLFRWFWSSLQMAGWMEKMNSQMAVSLMCPLFANTLPNLL